jgi:DNA-binding FadR family transcriptional regulator
MKGRVAAANLNAPDWAAQVSVPEIWDVRRTIELRTAELAAVTRTDEEAAAIMAHADALARDIDDLETTTAHDIAFHRAVASASHNLLFVQILESLEPLLEVAVPTAWKTRATEMQRRLMVERHQSVAAAIMRQDAIGATMAMSAHFDAAIGDMLRAARRMHAV